MTIKQQDVNNELWEHNKQLVEAANQAGVESRLEFAIFQNHGYQGLLSRLKLGNNKLQIKRARTGNEQAWG